MRSLSQNDSANRIAATHKHWADALLGNTECPSSLALDVMFEKAGNYLAVTVR